jgi:hypothetical protein
MREQDLIVASVKSVVGTGAAVETNWPHAGHG